MSEKTVECLVFGEAREAGARCERERQSQSLAGRVNWVQWTDDADVKVAGEMRVGAGYSRHSQLTYILV